MITLNQYRVLSSIERGNDYGYAICNDTGLFLGSIYNMLVSLRNKGYLKMQASDRRTVYALTEQGKDVIIDFRKKVGDLNK